MFHIDCNSAVFNGEDNEKTADEEAEEEKKPRSNVMCPHYILFA